MRSKLNITVNQDYIDFYSAPNSNTAGSYNRENNWIRINTAKFDTPEIRKTVVHECRHAYQWETVQGIEKHVVSNQTIDEWRKSFDTYSQDTSDYGAYAAQTIEYDAYSFAQQYLEASVGGRYGPPYTGSWGNPWS